MIAYKNSLLILKLANNIDLQQVWAARDEICWNVSVRGGSPIRYRSHILSGIWLLTVEDKSQQAS